MLRKTHNAGTVLALVQAFAISSLVIGCSTTRVTMLESEPGDSGEIRKIWSGLSLAGQLTVEPTPTPSPGAAGFESERLWSQYDDWEPAVAADPSSCYVYQLTTRYDGPHPCGKCDLPALIFRRSSDGGATWDPDQFLTLTRRSQNDPQIEATGDGTVYAVVLNDYRPGVKFLKSSDHGNTWTVPIAITPPSGRPNWSDKPILASSSDGRDVYIGFNASLSFVSYSHDHGATFSRPVRTSADKRYWFHNSGAVSPQGAVYFGAADFSQDYTGDAHINVLRSIDGGHSWRTIRVDTSREQPDCPWSPGCYLGFFGSSTALAVDPSGTIVLAYNAGDVPRGPQQMYARTSTDGGDTWTPRLEVSDGAPTTNNAFPALAAGPTPGDFRLIWQDDRNGSTTAWNTWFRRTTDGGLTWSDPIRVSDLGVGAPYKNPDGYFFPYGDYVEIAVDGQGTSHLIWGEGLSYVGPGGTWYTRGR
jgi:hypothetical protein